MRSEQRFFTGQATLTDAQALGVCLGILQPDPAVPAGTQQELADHFGVSQKTVSNFPARYRSVDQEEAEGQLSNYVSTDGTTVHVSGVYASGCPILQIKIEATGTIHPVAHKDRAGKPFASTQYRKLVRYLIAQGVTWDGMAHIENGFWPGE